MSTKMSYQHNTNDFTLVIYVTWPEKPVLSTQTTPIHIIKFVNSLVISAYIVKFVLGYYVRKKRYSILKTEN